MDIAVSLSDIVGKLIQERYTKIARSPQLVVFNCSALPGTCVGV